MFCRVREESYLCHVKPFNTIMQEYKIKKEDKLCNNTPKIERNLFVESVFIDGARCMLSMLKGNFDIQ